jgi:peroxiredoxin
MKRTMLLLTGLLFMISLMDAKEPYKAGSFASDFSLMNVKGEMVSLSDFKDTKGFIVVFACNTCPVVKKYEQRIIDLNSEFSPKGYPVVMINSNDKSVSPGDSFDEMKKVAADKGYSFDYLYDESQEVAREYGATNTPHVYVLSRDENNLKVEYVGAIDNNADNASMADKHYVKDAVNSLLKGRPVPVAGTKAIGCTIKWNKG